jgi:hypothetical protein
MRQGLQTKREQGAFTVNEILQKALIHGA